MFTFIQKFIIKKENPQPTVQRLRNRLMGLGKYTRINLRIEVASVTETKEMCHPSLLPSQPVVPESLLPFPSLPQTACPSGPVNVKGARAFLRPPVGCRETSRGPICSQILFLRPNTGAILSQRVWLLGGLSPYSPSPHTHMVTPSRVQAWGTPIRERDNLPCGAHEILLICLEDNLSA